MAEAQRIAARPTAATPARSPAARQPARLAPLQRAVLMRCACGGNAGHDTECDGCKSKSAAKLQREALGGAAPATRRAPPIVHQVLHMAGRPLDRATRAYMEPRFGRDFSHVRLHTDAQAATSARAVQAAAYTVGSHIVFGAARHSSTPEGQKLLAHELAHVSQQAGSGAVPADLEVDHPASRAEREAEVAADLVTHADQALMAQGLTHVRRTQISSQQGSLLHRSPDLSTHRPSVLPGETDLRQVALRLNVDPDSLVFANPQIRDPLHLSPGQIIYLPVNSPLGKKPLLQPVDRPLWPISKPEEPTSWAPHIDTENLSLDNPLPGCLYGHVIGESWGSAILLDIAEDNATNRTLLRIYDFKKGEPHEYKCTDWEVRALSFSGRTTKLVEISKRLPIPQIRALWPDASEKLLELHEEGKIHLGDELILSTYRGLIETKAHESLSENEEKIDALLKSSDKVEKLRVFASSYKDASEIRDRLKDEMQTEDKRIAKQYSGVIGNIEDVEVASANRYDQGDNERLLTELYEARDELSRKKSQLEDALDFWEGAFPLLKRLKTSEMNPQQIASTLVEIKTNIQEARKSLNTGQTDVWELTPVRQQVDGRLGKNTKAVIDDEETSKKHSTWIWTAATTVGLFALAFVPGGAFLETAIGFAIALKSLDEMKNIGHEANTGLSPDDGLMSQAQASGARFAAFVSVILAAAGPLASGFKALRAARNYGKLTEAFPGLTEAERSAIARVLVGKPKILQMLAAGPADEATLQQIRTAIREAGGNSKGLTKALNDIGDSARIGADKAAADAAAADAQRAKNALADGAHSDSNPSLKGDRHADRKIKTRGEDEAKVHAPGTTGKGEAGGIAEDEVRALGNMDDASRTKLGSDPELRHALHDSPLAAAVLKKCASPCFPPELTADQVSFLEDTLRRFKGSGAYDEQKLKDFLYVNRGDLNKALGDIAAAKDAGALRDILSKGAMAKFEAGGGKIKPIAARESPAVRSAVTERAYEIGERYGRQYAVQTKGLTGTGFTNPFRSVGKYGQGFDDIMLHGTDIDKDLIYIVEYKGGSSVLSDGQMTREWVLKNIARLRNEGGAAGQSWAQKLTKALRENRLRGSVISTPITAGSPQATLEVGAEWVY